MKQSRYQSGLTITEVVVTLAVVFILFCLFIVPTRQPADRITLKCINYLKNVGLAARIFAVDHDDRFPNSFLLTNNSPTGANIDALQYFLQLSNELATPRIIYCPADKQRKRGNHWTELSFTNISYFISLTADESVPNTFLAGDRNLQVGGKQVPGGGTFALRKNMTLGWTKEIHNGSGHILFGDGSVQQFSSSRLSEAARSQNVATNFLLMP